MKFRRKTMNYDDTTQYRAKGTPKSEGSVKDLISIKALKNLPHSSYSVTADPYTASLPTSRPYNIINGFNATVGGQYMGVDNIDGGNVQQYANSLKSAFLKYPDAIRTQLNLNYRYLPIKDPATPKIGDRGAGLVDEMIQSIAEALSVLKSTTYTQMAINGYSVVTDMSCGSITKTAPKTTDGKARIYKGSDNPSAVYYLIATYYQIVWQELINTINWHNSFRMKQGTMIRNS